MYSYHRVTKNRATTPSADSRDLSGVLATVYESVMNSSNVNDYPL